MSIQFSLDMRGSEGYRYDGEELAMRYGHE